MAGALLIEQLVGGGVGGGGGEGPEERAWIQFTLSL